jgi:branched-chain amino acid transport system ATP-binding protein
MSVRQGEIVGLIGPNGAGKTTVFNLITGILQPDSGTITFEGKDITAKRPHEVAALGIARTFQLTPLFPFFTVLENVTACFHLHPRSGLLDTFFNTKKYRLNEARIREDALGILRMLGLERFKDEFAVNLPHGFQKLLGMARAMAVRPKLMLLDEPTSGMNWEEISNALSIIRKMRDGGLTIVLVEHNMEVIDICDRVVAMNFGQKIAEGTVQEIRENKEVVEAYLGGAHVA